MAQKELTDAFVADLAADDDDEKVVSSKPAEEEIEVSEGAEASEDTEAEGTEEIEGGEEAGEAHEELPAHTLTPPNSMTASEVEQFGELTPEMQDFVVRREQDRDSHFAQNTHIIAEEKREVDALKQQWTEQLNVQAQQLGQITTADIAPPDPAIRDTDPEVYDDQMAAYVHNLHVQKQAEKQLAVVKVEQKKEHTRQTEIEANRVKQLIPEFNDPKKASDLQNRIFSYAKQNGYKADELAHVTASDVLMLHKAMLYDDMSESGRKLVSKKPAARAPKSAKAGAARGIGSKRKDKFAKLQKDLKKGDDKAMVGLFEMQLESEGY